MRKLENSAIIMDSKKDQVAIAKKDISQGVKLIFNNTTIIIRSRVKRGHHFAVCRIKKGEYVRQYGYPFGRSRGIEKGELISTRNLENILPKVESYNFRNWNKKQKENDLHNLKLETKVGRPKLLTNEERKIRSNEQAKKYYYKNKAKINLRIIEYRKNNKEWHNNYVKI